METVLDCIPKLFLIPAWHYWIVSANWLVQNLYGKLCIHVQNQILLNRKRDNSEHERVSLGQKQNHQAWNMVGTVLLIPCVNNFSSLFIFSSSCLCLDFLGYKFIMKKMWFFWICLHNLSQGNGALEGWWRMRALPNSMFSSLPFCCHEQKLILYVCI